MLSIDFQCKNKHRFEGYFKDYEAFDNQLVRKLIRCPLCDTDEVKRIYTGCSIQAKKSIKNTVEKEYPTIFEAVREINKYVKENYENVGHNFADTARGMHYGVEEKRNIYGDTTVQEMEELSEEGIDVLPLIDTTKAEN